MVLGYISSKYKLSFKTPRNLQSCWHQTAYGIFILFAQFLISLTLQDSSSSSTSNPPELKDTLLLQKQVFPILPVRPNLENQWIQSGWWIDSWLLFTICHEAKKVMDNQIDFITEVTDTVLPKGYIGTRGLNLNKKKEKRVKNAIKISHLRSSILKWGAECLCHYGNVALESVLFAKAIFQFGSEVGCSGLSWCLPGEWLLPDWMKRSPPMLKKSNAFWVGLLCDIIEHILKFSVMVRFPVMDQWFIA